jgi:hypothetical protein
MPLDEFWKAAYPGGLILEIVALRDIRPGEELFMDYGDEWQQAWKKHVQEWKPFSEGDYVYPADMDETVALRTVKEQKAQPYPSNLATVCITPDWDRKKSNTITWSEPEWAWPEGMVYCQVLERNKGDHGDFVYTVEVQFRFSSGPDFSSKRDDEDIYIDLKVPRRAIRFVDKPYAGDEHLPGVFRHPIGFPDELVPKQWKSHS